MAATVAAWLLTTSYSASAVIFSAGVMDMVTAEAGYDEEYLVSDIHNSYSSSCLLSVFTASREHNENCVLKYSSWSYYSMLPQTKRWQ